MDQKLKKTIQWSVFVIILIALIISVVALVISMIQPTLFPGVNIDGFKSYITIASVFVSFLSAGLGGFSIWQANNSNKQSVQILNAISEIKSEQIKLSYHILSIRRTNIKQSFSAVDNQWEKDTISS